MRKALTLMLAAVFCLVAVSAFAADPAPNAPPPAAAPVPAAAPAAQPVATEGAVSKADNAWVHRDNLVSLKASLADLESALKANPNDFGLLWRISRAYFWMADQARDKVKKAEWGKLGYEFGDKAVAIKPDRVEGWYYASVSVGMWSEGIGILKGLGEGLKKKFDTNLDKALAIDKNYEGGGPIRTKGRSYFRLPGIAGGSNKKAMQWLNDSLAADPTRLRTKYYICDVLIDDGKKEEATKLLDEIIKADPKVGDYPDNIAAQGWAKELLKKIQEG